VDEASLYVGCNVLNILNDRFRVSVVLHRDGKIVKANKGKVVLVHVMKACGGVEL